MSRRVPRPLCPVCKDHPIARPWEMQTCGSVCGAIRRWQRYGAARRKDMTKAALRAKDVANAKRLTAYYRQELETLGVPVTLENARVLNGIYRKGRHDEYRKLMARLRKDEAA